MARVLALHAEIFRGLDQAKAEQPLPNPVDGDPGGERMSGIGQPLGQPDPVDRPFLFPTPDHFGNGWLKLAGLVRSVVEPALKNVGGSWFGEFVTAAMRQRPLINGLEPMQMHRVLLVLDGNLAQQEQGNGKDF